MEEKKEQPEWLEKARQNDINAWEKLVKEYESMVYHIAYRMMQNEQEAKDISQEIFVKVYRNLSKFDEKSAFSTWLYRIAVNTCIDALRKNKTKQTISWEQHIEQNKNETATYQTPENIYLQREKQNDIMETLHMQDMTYGEIAECLSVSLGTVKSRIARAREQFKKEFLAKKELFAMHTRQKSISDEKGGDSL